ncbi:molybdenum cofactor guanylyltransferase MobA [Thiohalorhabdus methylotrophus]|uniref:Molybdenum cofactor guanylyltransferase n=1 Tax=Thiohalorhabdus methylotrophus TaxID=3242694 RepID=A0ABV4TVV3_9GAMM
MAANPQQITGVILAGGRAKRMGGADKGLLEMAGRPALEYAIERLQPQVDRLVINANRNRGTYAAYGFPVVPDEMADYPGPLAGMAAALRAAETEYILTVPCDCPWLPLDLATRLQLARRNLNSELATVETGEGLQPVFALLHRSLLDSLLTYLQGGGRKIDRWFARHLTALADFSDCPEAFTNINTPEQRATAESELPAPPEEARSTRR